MRVAYSCYCVVWSCPSCSWRYGAYRPPNRAAAHRILQQCTIAPYPVLPYTLTTRLPPQQLSSRINNNIEKQMVNAASSGKLTIMKNKGELEA